MLVCHGERYIIYRVFIDNICIYSLLKVSTRVISLLVLLQSDTFEHKLFTKRLLLILLQKPCKYNTNRKLMANFDSFISNAIIYLTSAIRGAKVYQCANSRSRSIHWMESAVLLIISKSKKYRNLYKYV